IRALNQLESYDINQLVEQVVADHLHQARISVDGYAVERNVSRRHVKMAVKELIDNAVKYGDQASQIRIRVRSMGDGQAEIVVDSAGPPLSEDIRGTLFEEGKALHQAANGRSRLGLPFVWWVMQSVHGGGRVDWQPLDAGRGNRFTLTFPKGTVQYGQPAGQFS